MFVHQIAKCSSKDDCGLHAPLAGGQAKSNNRDGQRRKRRPPYIARPRQEDPDSGVIYVRGAAEEIFGEEKGAGLQLRLDC